MSGRPSVEKITNSGQQAMFRWYKSYVNRYVYDPLLFVKECLNYQPTFQQLQLLEIINESTRLAVRSGHGTGKSTTMASIMLWFLTCRPMSRVLATGPNISILNKVLWPELAGKFWQLQQVHPPIANLFGITRTTFFSVQHPQEWFAIARTAKKDGSGAQGIAGQHAENLLVIVEEASAVGEEVFEVLDGALTGGLGNKVVMVGNPTATSGRFYDAFHSKSDTYKTLHWDGEESPLVSDEMISLFKEEYQEGSREYEVRVKGNFPSVQSGMLLGRPEIEGCVHRELDFPTPPMRIISVDVAGSGRDSSVIMLIDVCGDGQDRLIKVEEVREYQIGVDTVQLAGEIAFLSKQWPCRIIVDSIGVGQGVVDFLTHNDVQHIPCNWGQPSWFKDRFNNQRAEAHHFMRECMVRKQVHLPRNPKLFDQLANLPYGFTDRGKLAMWPKERMATKGIKSPDLSDSLAMSFLVPYEPLTSYAQMDTGIVATEGGEDAFADFLNTEW